MIYVLKGKIRGSSIELEEKPIFPDGTEVEVEVRVGRLAHLERAFGGWQDDPDLDKALGQIDQERHTQIFTQLGKNTAHGGVR